jgi:hypothetical protein
MDSPIFGSQKSSQNSKGHKYPEYSTTQSEINPPEWYVTSKNSINSTASQISHDLKLAYSLLIIEKNLKFLSSKINRWYFYFKIKLKQKEKRGLSSNFSSF